MVCKILNRKTKILRHFENLQNYGSLYEKTLVRDRKGKCVSLQILFFKKKKRTSIRMPLFEDINLKIYISAHLNVLSISDDITVHYQWKAVHHNYNSRTFGPPALLLNNYWMRLSMISWIIKTEVCVIRRSRRLRQITQTRGFGWFMISCKNRIQ